MATRLLAVRSRTTAARPSLDRYTRTVELSKEELHRLPAMMLARPLALDLWSVAHDRMSSQQAIARCRAHRARAEAVAAALDNPGRSPASPSSPRRPPSP